jgi:hypothetical protein
MISGFIFQFQELSKASKLSKSDTEITKLSSGISDFISSSLHKYPNSVAFCFEIPENIQAKVSLK